MPALGIGLPIFLLVQAAIAWFSYSEIAHSNKTVAALIGLCVFVVPVTLAFWSGEVVDLVFTELVLLCVYLLIRELSNRRLSTN